MEGSSSLVPFPNGRLSFEYDSAVQLSLPTSYDALRYPHQMDALKCTALVIPMPSSA